MATCKEHLQGKYGQVSPKTLKNESKERIHVKCFFGTMSRHPDAVVQQMNNELARN